MATTFFQTTNGHHHSFVLSLKKGNLYSQLCLKLILLRRNHLQLYCVVIFEKQWFAPQGTHEHWYAAVPTPERRCVALAQVREINYRFVCKKLIFSIYGSWPGQLLFLKSIHKAPVLCPSGWFLLPSGHDFGGSVQVSLTSAADGLQGTFLGGWQEQVRCLFPLRETFYCSGQLNWGHLGSFWKSFVFLHLHWSVTQLSLPTPSLPRAGQPSQPIHASLQPAKSASRDASPAQEQLFQFISCFMWVGGSNFISVVLQPC